MYGAKWSVSVRNVTLPGSWTLGCPAALPTDSSPSSGRCQPIRLGPSSCPWLAMSTAEYARPLRNDSWLAGVAQLVPRKTLMPAAMLSGYDDGHWRQTSRGNTGEPSMVRFVGAALEGALLKRVLDDVAVWSGVIAACGNGETGAVVNDPVASRWDTGETA